MTEITIYHNPACRTSRSVLSLLAERGANPQIIEYLKTPPTRDELVALVRQLGGGVRTLLRQKGTPYEELDLGNSKWSDSQLIDFILQYPILMNRPVVVTPKGVRLCRPAETVLELL
jgi:arsenate reductase